MVEFSPAPLITVRL